MSMGAGQMAEKVSLLSLPDELLAEIAFNLAFKTRNGHDDERYRV